MFWYPVNWTIELCDNPEFCMLMQRCMLFIWINVEFRKSRMSRLAKGCVWQDWKRYYESCYTTSDSCSSRRTVEVLPKLPGFGSLLLDNSTTLKVYEAIFLVCPLEMPPLAGDCALGYAHSHATPQKIFSFPLEPTLLLAENLLFNVSTCFGQTELSWTFGFWYKNAIAG